MAFHSPLTKLLATLFLFTACASRAAAVTEDCGIPIYWGSNSSEGSLKSTCDTGLYNMVHITFLVMYNSPNPNSAILFLGDHCNTWTGGCTTLTADILHCQSIGVKVLLTIDIQLDNSETAPAQPLVDYLWHSFLGGGNGSYRRPFGNAALDGIDLSVNQGPARFFYELAWGLKEKNVYLSASPGCEIPNLPLDVAMRAGLFDSISVLFVNLECDYSHSGRDGVVSTWNRWLTSTSPVTKLYFSVPASPDAFDFPAGFVPAVVMDNEILPRIRYSERYAGVGLYNRYFDTLSNYSSAIAAPVCDYTGKKEKKKKNGGGGIKKFLISQVV